jgi:hypothetical protein
MSGRIVLIPILGHEPSEIPPGLRIGCFYVFSAVTISQTRQDGLGGRYRDSGGRGLDLEICRIQVLVVVVDCVNVNLIPFGVCLEFELRDAALSSEGEYADFSGVQRHVEFGFFTRLIEDF